MIIVVKHKKGGIKMITLFFLFFVATMAILLFAVILAAISGFIALLPAIMIVGALVLIDVVFFMLLSRLFNKNDKSS